MALELQSMRSYMQKLVDGLYLEVGMILFSFGVWVLMTLRGKGTERQPSLALQDQTVR